MAAFAGVLLGATSAESADAGSGAQRSAPARVVIVAVPDLRWSDLTFMPFLSSYAESSSVAALSVKSVSTATRCPDGELTFSAGTRIGAGGGTSCILTAPELAGHRAAAMHGVDKGQVGAFGSALQRAGLTTAAANPSAVALLGDSAGAVDTTVTDGDLSQAAQAGSVAAVVDQGLYDARQTQRDAAAAALDRSLQQQVATLPPDTVVVVAGISDGARTDAHLHVLLVHGPGWAHRALRSAPTRPPYVQLIDLAPTILSLLHVPVPATMIGRPAYVTGAPAVAASHYADLDRHAAAARSVSQPVRDTLGALGLAVIALLALGLRHRRANAAAVWLARLAVAAPLCTFLAQLVPWWRWGTWAYSLVLAGGCVLFAVSVTASGSRWGVRAALLLAPAVTVVALIADQLAGAGLQMSAPLGDNPTTAGRFHGMGNIDFALMCSSALLCAAVIGGRLSARGQRLGALAAAAGISAAAVVVDAAPQLGDDLGGLLSMLPAVVVLLALVIGIRVTWRRAALASLLVVALIVGVPLLDYLRPAAHQTHMGRFVGQVLHGGAGDVVTRKLHAVGTSFGNVAVTGFVVVLIAGVLLARARLVRAVAAVPGLGAGCVAVAVLALLGTFLNDSGEITGMMALYLALLAPVAAGLARPRVRAGPAGNDAPGTMASAAEEGR